MNQERLMKVLLAPHVSEKGTILGEKHGQYIFKVVPDATKPEIRQAVELMFEVKVSDVQVANMKGKAKRFGQFLGRRPSWKKAYVKLEPGHSIELMGPE